MAQIYFRGLFLSHKPFFLEYSVLFPQVELKQRSGLIVTATRLISLRLSPDSGAQLVIWLTENWQNQLR